MSTPDVYGKRTTYVESLQSAYEARRGATPAVEVAVRAYARALRETGVAVGAALIDVKNLVRLHTGIDEPIFVPKVVGWAVTGYFEGTGPRERDG